MEEQNRINHVSVHAQRDQLSQVRAPELCQLALDQARTMFSQGDLLPYVEVLSRFHAYNFYNLLLILSQYPSATCLASYYEWAQILGDPSGRVLKQGSSKNLIELITPCISRLPHSRGAVGWQAIKLIDISQTNVTGYQPPSKGYLKGDAHIHALVSALCVVLSEQHDISVLYEYGDSTLSRADAVGYRDDICIHCRQDAPQTEQLLFLCGILVELSNPEQIVGETYKDFFCHLAVGSLLRIWDIKDPSLLFVRKNADLVRAMPLELQLVFLSLLQRRVRRIEEDVHCIYQSHIQSREEEARILNLYHWDASSRQESTTASSS